MAISAILLMKCMCRVWCVYIYLYTFHHAAPFHKSFTLHRIQTRYLILRKNFDRKQIHICFCVLTTTRLRSRFGSYRDNARCIQIKSICIHILLSQKKHSCEYHPKHTRNETRASQPHIQISKTPRHLYYKYI